MTSPAAGRPLAAPPAAAPPVAAAPVVVAPVPLLETSLDEAAVTRPGVAPQLAAMSDRLADLYARLAGQSLLARAAFEASTGQSPAVAQASGSAPSPPAPGGASGSASGGLSGAASSALFALLVALAAIAVGSSRGLRLAPARWRPTAFVAVIERPG
jgi:hypothetical protein